MCTVTLLPTNNSGFILTSNRDEAASRHALAPAFYSFESAKLLYPKDKSSGGSWIGLSDKHRLICLLNGGFVKHNRLTEYRQSRGIVVKHLLAAKNLQLAITAYDFSGIEPFTLVIVDWHSELQFYELVWDGVDKHLKKLPLEPRIWSSSTLYTEDKKLARVDWFSAFLAEKEGSSKDLLDFHKNTQPNNLDFGLLMDRGFVKTTSITQVEKTKERVTMRYENLNNKDLDHKALNDLHIIND